MKQWKFDAQEYAARKIYFPESLDPESPWYWEKTDKTPSEARARARFGEKRTGSVKPSMASTRWSAARNVVTVLYKAAQFGVLSVLCGAYNLMPWRGRSFDKNAWDKAALRSEDAFEKGYILAIKDRDNEALREVSQAREGEK
jgi:hypothetical protein